MEVLANLETQYTGELLEGEGVVGDAGPLSEECRAAYSSVVRRLVEAYRVRGTTDEALRYGLRLLRVDPYDEAMHLSLVGLLAAASRHGESLRHYRRYTARMRDLGLEPMHYPGAAAEPPPAAQANLAGTS